MAAVKLSGLSYESLDKITGLGLTDRRYRQLAKEGCFPEPVAGKYDGESAIRGLLKYYRDKQNELREVKQAIADEQHRKLKRENDIAMALLIPRASVVSEFHKAIDPVKILIRQKLENELPQAMAGLDVPQARILGKRFMDDLFSELQKLFAAFDI